MAAPQGERHAVPVSKDRAHHEIRSAIVGAEEFIEAKRDGYVVFDYRFVTATTFPDIEPQADETSRRVAILRREARGLIGDPRSGRVIGRRFHKFFNLGERDETRPDRVDLGQPHALLDKLDGSMISPILIGERLAWTTMLGETDVAAGTARFVAERPRYSELARMLIDAGANPIFEWCSLDNRVVIAHEEPKLVLLAVRDLVDGTYWPIEEIARLAVTHGMPSVETHETLAPDCQRLSDHVGALEGREGFVVRFADGHMLKLKTPWYLRIHQAKERLEHETGVVEIILHGELDDLLPFVSPAEAADLQGFADALNRGLAAYAAHLDERVAALQARHGSRKDIALAIQGDADSPFLFRMLGGGTALDLLRAHVLKECGSGPRLDAARRVFGARWTRHIQVKE
jgi:RNA ligase